MSPNGSSGFYPYNEAQFGLMLKCYVQKSGIIITTALTVTYVLFLLPLYIYILHLGFQRWRRQSTAASHSDFLAYNAVLVELFGVLGFIFICCGIHTGQTYLSVTGIKMTAVQYMGQLLFQSLTCAERYLAVVHPVAYMRQKNSRGIRIRNIIVGCSWLLCFSFMSLMLIKGNVTNTVLYFVLLTFSIVTVSFFSCSVLYVLIRPRPAEVANSRQQVDQQKMKAFKMMMAIFSVLVLKLASSIFSTATYTFLTDYTLQCHLWLATLWTNIPSTLVIPLLYMQRQRKAPCCPHRK